MNPTCTVPGCTRPQRRKNARTRPWCDCHYTRWRLYGRPDEPSHWRQRTVCTVDGCDGPNYAHGLCVKHAARMRKYGNVTTVKVKKGSINATTNQGYILVKRRDHPNASKVGWLAEHRLVMSEILGRSLYAWEEVHHKNGNRADNRPENLELWTTSQPIGQRVTDKVAWAVELLELYAPELLATKPTQLRLVT